MHTKHTKFVLAIAIACAVVVPACTAITAAVAGAPAVPDGVAEPAGIAPRASDYHFKVTNMLARFYLEYDGSVTIKYNITFRNLYSPEDLDVADIGFPNGNYLFESVKASITSGGGATWHELTGITKSPYVQHGVAVDFGPYTIDYLDEEMLYVECNNPRVLYSDSEDSSKASFVFTPTWFDPSYASSTIDVMNVTLYFVPNELDGSQLKYHEKPSPWEVPEGGLQNFTSPLEQRLYYEWNFTSLYQSAHEFGASFPKSWVAAGVIQTDPWLVVLTWVLVAVGAGAVVLVSVVYLVAQHKKKASSQYYPPVQKAANPFGGIICCSVVITAVVVFVFVEDFFMLLYGVTIALLVLAFVFIAFFIAKAIDKRRLKYEKPKLSIECVGVNKNLTVPEAAIIKNTPLGTVVFLIIFSMMRKGVIEISKNQPLQLEKKVKILTENLRKVAEEGRKLRDYEVDFYDAIGPKGAVIEAKLRETLIRMIKKTHTKMVGFDLKATIAYHETMMEKAWNQIKNTSGDIKFDEIADQFGYLLLDEDFSKKAPTYFGGRTIYMPYWYARPYAYWGATPGVSSSIAAPFARTGGMGAINAVDFATSISTGLSNLSSSIATNASNFFSSIVNAVSPTPSPSSGGGGGGRSYSGGSCACACACACAGCACACAGGGR
ncbi:MAG: hypothetical protein JW839_21935 [Candidatus Lokiarchaeota archaeon]|nr:hypothetical protein [Candidatus Lokiarchaeota archaeon]